MSRPWRPLFVRPARSFACGGLPPRRVAGRRGARQSDKRRAAGCGIDGPAALDARHIYTDDVARCAVDPRSGGTGEEADFGFFMRRLLSDPVDGEKR